MSLPCFNLYNIFTLAKLLCNLRPVFISNLLGPLSLIIFQPPNSILFHLFAFHTQGFDTNCSFSLLLIDFPTFWKSVKSIKSQLKSHFTTSMSPGRQITILPRRFSKEGISLKKLFDSKIIQILI